MQLRKSLLTKTCIDLTHKLHAGVPTWDGSCGFNKIVISDYSENQTKTNFHLQRFDMQAGIGTHMDAPCHCFKNGLSIADIPLQDLILPLIVVDVSSKAHADLEITVEDILTFEKKHGLIPSQSLLICYTGWSRYWGDTVRYRNADERGQVHFPSINEKAAELLLKRSVSGIAIDTLSPDLGINGRYPVHELFLGAGKYLLENVANAHLLPPVGALGIILPIKIDGGAEAPVRFIALI